MRSRSVVWIAFGALVCAGGCARITELPCNGDAAQCEDVAQLASPGMSFGAGGSDAAARPEPLIGAASLGRQACTPGHPDSLGRDADCLGPPPATPVRPGLEGRPRGADGAEALRLRMRSNQIAGEISRLDPGDREGRADLRRTQRRIDQRVRTLETPSLRVPPPGVGF